MRGRTRETAEGWEVNTCRNAKCSSHRSNTMKTKPVMGNAIPVLGVKPKRVWCVVWLFFKIGLCSAVSFKRSRRELSIDVAEHRSMLKNYQNTHYHSFSFILKIGTASPKTGVLFLLWTKKDSPRHIITIKGLLTKENLTISTDICPTVLESQTLICLAWGGSLWCCDSVLSRLF